MTSFLALLLGDLAGFMVGFAKSGLPGAGIMVVPIMALGFGAKASVGLLLPMLVVGDAFAVCYYRRHADWGRLWRLLPWVAPGMAAGYFTLDRIPNDILAPLLGGIVLLMLGLQAVQKRYKWEAIPHTWWFAAVTGTLAGFSTTVGNAAGPIMNLYLLSMGMDKQRFMGTSAWFFMIVNWAKVPLLFNLELITPETLLFNFAMAPAIAAGALTGVLLLPKIPQKLFNNLVVILAAIVAAKLLIG